MKYNRILIIITINTMIFISCSNNSIVVYRNNIGIDLIKIHAGSFKSGNITNIDIIKEKEYDPVKLDIVNSFYIGKTEVTQKQWTSIMEYNPSANKGDNLPVTNITIVDVKMFLNKLSKIDGNEYRLPTNIEWEYAYRAGTTTTYYYGNEYVGDKIIDKYAWYSKNSSNKTHNVAEKKPNAWGIHDMNGNVWEFTINNINIGEQLIMGGGAQELHVHIPPEIVLLPFIYKKVDNNFEDDFVGFRIARDVIK